MCPLGPVEGTPSSVLVVEELVDHGQQGDRKGAVLPGLHVQEEGRLVAHQEAHVEDLAIGLQQVRFLHCWGLSWQL